MNGLPYYKAYPRDFIEGTIGMPFEMKCAYRVILDLIYMQGGDLPDDARYIAGHLGCSVRKWNSVREFLIGSGKLQLNGEFLTNYRAVKELESLAKLQDRQRENRSGANKNKGLQKPRSRQPEPEPEPKNKRDTNVSLKEDHEFNEFWSIVPRKVGKGSAQKAWAKAIKSADPQTIIDGMQRYAFERDGKDPQYTAHPASWLNAQRWTDEAPASQQDFHNMISKALEVPNAISGPRETDHGQAQRIPAPLQAPGTPGPERGAGGTAGNGGGNERAYADIIRPKRFGGADY